MKNIVFLISVTFCFPLSAQIDKNKLFHYCDSMLNYGVSYPMIPGGVLGIASSDSVLFLKGYGYSNYEKKIPVTINETIFQFGSVGKLITSIALLQQVEKGKISLDDNVDDYLVDWKIKNPFEEKVTPFHLLTHSAGFNDQFIGYMAKSNNEIQPLSVHLPKKMPGLFKAPGLEINYSNYSYALAGHLVERVSDNSFEDQANISVFEPLNMNTASYFLPDDYLQKDKYANGYQLRETFNEVKMYPRHAKPAGSLVGTGKDMIKLAQALLKRDSLLLNEESYNLMFNQQFSNHEVLTGYTLGMEAQNINGKMAIAKSGQVTGFLSVLILFPELDLAFFLATNTETDNFFEKFFEGLKTNFFPPTKPNIAKNISFNIEDYTGSYSIERCNHETIEEFFTLFMGHFQFYKSESGNLTAYHNSKWHEYQYLGNDVFQDIENKDRHIAFKRRETGELTSLYRGVNVGGIDIPASYRKLNWLERPRFINDEYPYALTLMSTYILIPILWIGLYFIRKKNANFLKSTSIPFYYHAVAFLFIGLFFWNVIGFFIPLLKLGKMIVLGLPESLILMKYFNWAMAFVSVILLFLSIKIWLIKESRFWFRVYYTLVSLISFSYILLLHRWHFLNIEV